jgi:formylglycine-generating enzyme required for sulfatase activity
MNNWITFFLILLSCSQSLQANNIQVTNITFAGRDVSAGPNNADNFIKLQFNLSWNNSWRVAGGPSNWDAAWVFVKFRVSGGQWQHALLHNTGHTAASGSSIDVGLLSPDLAYDPGSNPAMGAFVYRNNTGAGNVNYSNMQLRWNYGRNGVADNAVLDIRVYAVEMVYVPQAAFFVGGGSLESGSFTNGSWISGNNIPLQISSENSISIAQTSGNLWGTSSSGSNSIGGSGTLSAQFPKGFKAFYCMKYEISQGQYRDFLNSLSYTQQLSRTTSSPGSVAGTAALSNINRNGIDIQVPGVASSLPAVYACNLNGNAAYNEATDGEWIACNLLSWMDGAAYLDWAGLRPMTELEYEKACRGNQTPVPGEFAWGTATATSANNITNSGAGGEITTTPGANAVFNSQPNVSGPMRVGVFAGVATSRAAAGTSYWGIAELSGNLWERTVSVGVAQGRNYTGTHGNGALSLNGHANVVSWPGLDGNLEVSGAAGSGLRGGDWINPAPIMRVSDRTDASSTYTTRDSHFGFRGIRTAP